MSIFVGQLGLLRIAIAVIGFASCLLANEVIVQLRVQNRLGQGDTKCLQSRN
jgi:hypothetical protein